MQPSFTREEVIKKYYELSHGSDKEERSAANQYINLFQQSAEAWLVAKELLYQSADADMQFIGASVLYRKVKQEITQLSELQQKELKQFFLDTLVNPSLQLSALSTKQVCASISIIAILHSCTFWPTLLSDLIDLMKLSKASLLVGLEILENISKEMGEVLIEKKVYQRTKSYFFSISEQILEIFNNILIMQDEDILVRCLSCMCSWVSSHIKLQLLRGEKSIPYLLQLMQYEKLFPHVCQILTESCLNSLSSDVLNMNNIETQIKNIPQIEIHNLKLIVEILSQNLELFKQNAKNFEYCKAYTETICTLANKFQILILEKSEYSFAILKILLFCSQHHNKRISYATFQFWKDYKQTIKRFVPNIRHPDNDCLIQPFTDLLAVLIQKCRFKQIKQELLAKLHKKLEKKQTAINRSINEISELDDDDDEDDEDAEDASSPLQDEMFGQLPAMSTTPANKKMGMISYRSEAEDVFVAILQALLEFREDKGQQYFFSIIYHLLDKECVVSEPPPSHEQQQQPPLQQPAKQPKEEMEHILDVEVAFYIIHATIEVFIFTKSNPYINQIFQYIITWNLPQHNLIILSAMQFMNDGALELKYSPILLDGTIQFLLRYLSDATIGRFAVQTLEGMFEQFEKHEFVNAFNLVAQFMVDNFIKIQDNFILNHLTSAVFGFALKLKSEEFKMQSLAQLLLVIEQKISFFTSQIQIMNQEDFEKILDILNQLLIEFDNITEQRERAAIIKVASEFLNKNLLVLNTLFENYGAINQLITTKFISMFKYIIKVCEENISKGFITFLNTSLKIFQMDPIKNVQTLGIFCKLVEILPPNNQALTTWMLQNFDDFNSYMLNLFNTTHHKDPELIKMFTSIQHKIIQFNEQIFFNNKFFDQIIPFLVQSLVQINEYEMNRTVLIFLASYIQAKPYRASEKVAQYYRLIMKSIVLVIPDIMRTNYNNLALIFIKYTRALLELRLDVMDMLMEGFLDKKFELFKLPQKKLLCDGIIYLSQSEDTRELKVLIQEISNVINKSLIVSDIFLSLELKLNHPKTQQKTKQQQIMETLQFFK